MAQLKNNIFKSCLSIEFLKKFDNQPQKSKEHIQKVIHKLEKRTYAHGLNVKRLKSKPSWAVWQAKLNDSNRLLFTFHKHLELSVKEKSTQHTYIHFWTMVKSKMFCKIIQKVTASPPATFTFIAG